MAADMASDLPSQSHALVLESFEAGFELKHISTPQPVHGSAVVKVISVGVVSYSREVYNGERHYSFPKPIVGGHSATARVAATGPDAALLKPGQLVYVDCVIHGRDDPGATFLAALHEGGTEGSKKLMRDAWRDWTFAEYARVPLENCIPLNETRLCHELGYSFDDLAYLSYLLVSFGGLRDIRVEPGETIVVCPATGGFGGAGVQVAIAMGARVIAMGRNEKELARLKEHIMKGTPWAKIETVKMSGDKATDTAALQSYGTIDGALDLSPPAASKSTHLESVISSLRRGGRVSLMGLVPIPPILWTIIGGNITLKGKRMYERDDMIQFVKMLEAGLFPKAKDFVVIKAYGLEDWKEALDEAAVYTGIGKLVTITP